MKNLRIGVRLALSYTLLAAPELMNKSVHGASVAAAARRNASPSTWGVAEFSSTCRA